MPSCAAKGGSNGGFSGAAACVKEYTFKDQAYFIQSLLNDMSCQEKDKIHARMHAYRHTDIHTHVRIDRQADRHTDRPTERQTETDRDRQRQIQTDRQTGVPTSLPACIHTCIRANVHNVGTYIRCCRCVIRTNKRTYIRTYLVKALSCLRQHFVVSSRCAMRKM